jgi:hypothetical protein
MKSCPRKIYPEYLRIRILIPDGALSLTDIARYRQPSFQSLRAYEIMQMVTCIAI